MMGDVVSDMPAVLVFTRDGDVMVFESPEQAAEWMEAVDVDAGEYPAVFAVDGRTATASTRQDLREGVLVTVNQEHDEAGLRERLERAVALFGLSSPASDPVAVANELLLRMWERRWPRRPRWLASRLHGDVPPRV